LSLELDVVIKQGLVLAVPLFRGIKPGTLLAIISELKPELALPNQVLVQQGLAAESMYFVVKGKLAVSINSVSYAYDYNGKEQQTVAVLRNGSCFGELALYGNKKRSATITALTYCELEALSYTAARRLAHLHRYD
jgi:CRP-like cAMP-binding protein